MKRLAIFCFTILIGLITTFVWASSSTQMINYQGRLTDSAGMPINGNTTVTFSIYDGETVGTSLWSETQTVTVNQGIYQVQLGTINPIPDDLFNGSERFLGVKVGSDPELTPRSRITSVAYAFNSQRIAGKKIQSGQGTLTVSGTASGSTSITFPVAFVSPPQVITGALNSKIESKTFIVEKVSNITTTGCDVSFTTLDGSTATGSADFDWIAIGQ